MRAKLVLLSVVIVAAVSPALASAATQRPRREPAKPAKPAKPAEADISITTIRPAATRPAADGKKTVLTNDSAAAAALSPQAVQARTAELLRDARAWETMARDWRVEQERADEVRATLALGPDAPRMILEALPRLDNRATIIMLQGLRTHLHYTPIDPAAVPAACAAVPAMVKTLQGTYWSSDLPAHGVLAHLATVPDALPAVMAGLTQANCESRMLMEVLKGADPEKVTTLMSGWIGDATISTPSRQRAVDAMMIVRSERGQQILLEMATGEYAGIRGADSAPAKEWEARSDTERENQVRLGLRNMAIRILGNRRYARRGDVNATYAAASEEAIVKALGKALGAGHRSTREVAAEHLSQYGMAGKLALIEHYERETDAERVKEVADRIAGALSFPRRLMDAGKGDGGEQTQASRTAAAQVMRILLQEDRAAAARELLRMAQHGGDVEVRRQAAITLLELRSRAFSSGGSARAWPSDDELQGLLASSDIVVADAAAQSFLGNNPFARPLSADVLRPLLKSPSRVQRDLAVRQLLQPRVGAISGADEVLPMLTSPYPDISNAAAQAIYRTDALRRSVGVDTARRIGLAMGVRCVEHIPLPGAPRVLWSTELPVAPVNATAAAAAAATITSLDESTPAAAWLWRLTWSTAALFVVAVAGVALFTMLTVPEPRLAVAREGR